MKRIPFAFAAATVATLLTAILAAGAGSAAAQSPAAAAAAGGPAADPDRRAPDAGAGRRAPADAPLVNLDAPGALTLGATAYRLDLRGFGGDEGQAYVGLGVRAGLGQGWEAGLRGVFSGRRTHERSDGSGGGVRHGGDDIELLARYSPPGDSRIAGLVGVAFPDTPAQNRGVLTLGAAGSADLIPGGVLTGYLNPRAAFVRDNSLVGIGIGLRARFAARGPSLVVDWTPMVAGKNTRDPATGRREQRTVYGVALRLPLTERPAEREIGGEVEIGFANAIGSTTGFSLTPGLGGSGAFYLSLALHR